MKKLLLLLPFILFSCTNVDMNSYEYIVEGDAESYDIAFLHRDGYMVEHKDCERSVIYAFRQDEGFRYVSVTNRDKGMVTLLIVLNREVIASKTTDRAGDKIVIQGKY
jgi:hypothetical protein